MSKYEKNIEYYRSDKFKERLKIYHQSEKGKLSRKSASKRYYLKKKNEKKLFDQLNFQKISEI